LWQWVVALRDDPLVQQTYRECAEHYGFLIDPCRVATPEHKGKVESGVHEVYEIRESGSFESACDIFDTTRVRLKQWAA
jgi:transposase